MKYLVVGGVLVGVGVLAYILVKKQPGQSFASAAGSGAVTAVTDATAGVVTGLGQLVGIPLTSQSQCDKDLAVGDSWAASFSCPASRFVGSVFNSTAIRQADATDLRQIDRIMERERARNDAAWAPATGEYEATYDAMGNYTGHQPVQRYGATGGW